MATSGKRTGRPPKTQKGQTPPGEPPPASAVPDYVKQSRTYQRKRITKRTLPTFAEAMLLIHAPEAFRLFWASLMEGLKAGDHHALEMFGEMSAYTRGKGGVNINLTQAMMNQNAAAGDASPVMGYDALVRQIAEARGQVLPAGETILDVSPAETVSVMESN